MILNTFASGIIAVVFAYLVGSIPNAYIVTRLVKGRDIRDLGTGHTGRGNSGARNVYVNVGKGAGVMVAVLDVLKGAGAAFAAEWLLQWPVPLSENLTTAMAFSLLAGVFAVAGHIWPVYIGFRGGAGLATALGVVAILMTRELGFAVAIIIVLAVSTRNIILSANLGLLTLPAWAALDRLGWWMIVFPLVVAAVMFVHFVPNIVAEIKKAGSFERLLGSLTRRSGTK